MADNRSREDKVKLSAEEAKALIDMIEDVEKDEASEQERRQEAREIADRVVKPDEEAA